MKKGFVRKIFRIIKNVLCWALIVALVSIVAIFLITRITGNVPKVFGYSIFRVSSGSMVPELEIGDVILDKDVENLEALQVGDIVTYEGSGSTEGMLITHQVIVAPHTNDSGQLVLQTKGIANEIADEVITADRVTAIMVCKLSFLNVVYSVFLSPWGLLIFIGLLILVFIDEIITIVKIATGNDKTAKDGEDINEIIERLQKEKLAEKSEENEDDKNEKI